MRDPRLTPANGRVALLSLKGQVEAERFTAGAVRRVARPVVDLRATPGGRRVRQVLLGAALTVMEERGGWAFVQAGRDGYVGYLPAEALDEAPAPTHMVATPATHAYAADDLKSPDLVWLPFGARLRVTDERRRFFETDLGFVPKGHLRPVDRPFSDPVTVAQLHFGVPYLWGGNSSRGIDCSGLVQESLHACGIACPGDSDLQQALGVPAAEDTPPRRGDLIFWKGHVGLMVDAETMIHANVHRMAVSYEPLGRAMARIEAQGDGPVTARRRL